MAKKFNITGTCYADEHYMADVSNKLAKIRQMVEDGDYFIINRPRQYGKTTTLYAITEMLNAKTVVFFNSTGVSLAVFIKNRFQKCLDLIIFDYLHVKIIERVEGVVNERDFLNRFLF